MRERRISPVGFAVGTLAVAVFVALALALLSRQHVHAVADGHVSRAAIEMVDGVPLGVVHSRDGALAAADAYVAVSAQALEQDPQSFAELVSEAYAPQVRSRVLSEAQEIRSGDVQDMANYAQGGHGLAVIAAQRLDDYTPTTADVTCWLEGIVWGPRLAPRQTWSLVDTTLTWRAGRWLVLDSHLDAAPAPVPAVVYVQAGSDTSAAFGRLEGMTSPLPGAGG